jgi:Tfp pilus assembly protein PilO
VTARFASLSPRAQTALVAGVLLVVTMMGYFVLIAPKRSTAADLKKQTASVQTQIDRNRSSAFTQALPAVRSANIFNLSQAMPSQLDTPEVILQLNQLAEDSGISFNQIQPGADGAAAEVTADATTPFAAMPIQVQFTGSYYNLLAFLQRLRNLVRVENGKLFTAGRLFDVSDVKFDAGPKGFPQIQATLIVNALVPQVPPAPTPGTDTTSTTTSNPTSAAPSTSGGTS